MTPREIDALVAEKVLGRETEWIGIKSGPHPYPSHRVPRYSADIAAAWEVVEKLRDDRHTVELFGYSRDTWLVVIDKEHRSQPDCDTAPMAICLAALRTVGVEIKWA